MALQVLDLNTLGGEANKSSVFKTFVRELLDFKQAEDT
jgi:hypothetical protein